MVHFETERLIIRHYKEEDLEGNPILISTYIYKIEKEAYFINNPKML